MLVLAVSILANVSATIWLSVEIVCNKIMLIFQYP
jgi:hypothetical protein